MGQVGFSAEMKSLCFLDYPLLLPPTAEEERHFPHHVSAHMPPPLLMKRCPVSLEAPFADPQTLAGCIHLLGAAITKYHELGG